MKMSKQKPEGDKSWNLLSSWFEVWVTIDDTTFHKPLLLQEKSDSGMMFHSRGTVQNKPDLFACTSVDICAVRGRAAAPVYLLGNKGKRRLVLHMQESFGSM